MKKFRYRLEAGLKVKEHLEKEKQKELATATHKVIRQKQAVENIQKNCLTTMDRKRDSMGANLSVAELLVYSRYLLKLRGDNLKGQELLRGLQKNEDEKRQSLLGAVKQRKIYDKLKDKQRERFHKEANSQMTKETDETGITRHRRKKKK